MPFSDLQDFMFAVRKESRPLNGVGALGRPVKNNLATAMPNCKLPPYKLVSVNESESQACVPYLCARQED